jgi:hypothetical protein
MPLHVKEFVIQAKFEEENLEATKKETVLQDVSSLKEDIVSECMEKLEEYLRKRERR